MEDFTILSSQYEPNGESTVLSSQYESNGESTVLSSQYESNGESTVLSSQYESSGESTVLSSRYESNGESTVLSSQYETGGESTVLSGSMQQEKQWDANYVLGPGDRVGEYTIVGAISGKSGEAQVFVGEKDGKKYAVKIYMQEVSLKEDVADLLVGKEIPYLSKMVETGKTRTKTPSGEKIERTYEISPLYRNFDRPISSYGELRKLIAQVNEGLHTLHKMKIFHKDIKPANIMMDEDNNYRIIDFGISSVADEGQTHLITSTGISHAYASPETRSARAAGTLQDYYSLGISLYELFAGKIPYDELEEYRRYYLLESEGVNIRESLGMPGELVKLIHGLTYYSNNPETNKKRWGYEQVKKWLENPDAMEDLDMSRDANASSGKKAVGNSEASLTYEDTFGFNKKQILDSYTLADELGSHWADGMKQVGRGNLRDFFKENGSKYNEYTTACEDTRIILEDAKTEMERKKAYWKLLYVIEPKLKKFYWPVVKTADGTTGYTCEELGVYLFLEAMENKKASEKIPDSIRELADSKLIPVYLKEQLHDEERSKKAEKLLEDLNKGDKEIAAWQLGYLLAGKARFYYHGQEFETREQLYQHVIEWTNTLTVDEALAVALEFKDTKEFQAWIKNQEEDE